MPAFTDTFDRPVGPVGNGWLSNTGELRINVTGEVHFVYAGQNVFENWTYEEPTGGNGWQLKELTSFQSAGWNGRRVGPDGLTYSYGLKDVNNSLDLGGRFDRTDIDVTSFDKAYAEWEVNGAFYGRKTNDPGGLGGQIDYAIHLLASDISVSGERFVRMLDINGNFVDRFRFGDPAAVPLAVPFFGGSDAAIMRPHRADPEGLWVLEMTGYAEGLPAENWGDMIMVLAASTLDGVGDETAIYAFLDVGGYIGVWYQTVGGGSVLQGSTNTNSVEDNSFSFLDAQGNLLPYPDTAPNTEFTYRLMVNPTTGVVTVTINGLVRGSCTIPAAEMARIKAAYDAGSAKYMGVGLNPFIFGEAKDTFVITSISGFVPNPPGTIANGARGANFVAPIY